MDTKSIIYGTLLFIAMHICVWVSTNLQFVKPDIRDKTLIIAIMLSIPTTVLAYYGSRFIFNGLDETLWGVRFIGFGISYLVFPILTWVLMKESPLTAKTLICTFLSFMIVCVQLFWND